MTSDARSLRPGSIAEELHQRRPFHSVGQEALLALLRTADAARRRTEAALAAEGVTLQQYNVLRILRGSRPQGLPTLEIGERMIERTPGVTRIIDRLERKGWVVRQRCTEDRRRIWCRITASGMEVLERLDAPVAAIDNALIDALGDDRLRRLITLLDDLRTELGAID